MSDWTERHEPRLPPLAPLDARFKAGALDLLLLGLLTLAYFAVPLIAGGLTLPMWGVFAAVLGYSVTPLILFRATLGMRVFGVEVMGKNGHPAQIIDLVFRELIGRGFFSAAYLCTLAAAVVASWLGLLRFAMPAGLGMVMFHVSWVLFAATVLGHFLVFTRPDRRSLADLVARTVVVTRVPQPLPADEDDRLQALRDRGARVRRLVFTEVLLLVLGVGLPWGLTRQAPGENTALYAERLKRNKLQNQFDRDPANRKLARQLYRAHLAVGDEAEAARMQQKHAAALAKLEQRSEDALRDRVRQSPTDEEGLALLLELLEAQGRQQDAVEAYRQAVTVADSPQRRAGFGIWLHDLGMFPLAEAELSRALDAGLEDPWALTYRGHTRVQLGRKPDALRDYQTALALDPQLQEAEEALVELEAQGVALDVP
jgi:uncharacterized RDD family membrane protein YckC